MDRLIERGACPQVGHTRVGDPEVSDVAQFVSHGFEERDHVVGNGTEADAEAGGAVLLDRHRSCRVVRHLAVRERLDKAARSTHASQICRSDQRGLRSADPVGPGQLHSYGKSLQVAGAVVQATPPGERIQPFARMCFSVDEFRDVVSMLDDLLVGDGSCCGRAGQRVHAGIAPGHQMKCALDQPAAIVRSVGPPRDERAPEGAKINLAQPLVQQISGGS
ncbi:hypothetical protein AMK21_18980 [Streptomyces sp. CB00316]|nr:hypothetical protein AMK21_18980 [Streptomyces sp. CB00316]